jgi:HSP20 family protein
MANVPVEVKRTTPTPTASRLPDAWRSFRQEMDQLFDRFPSFALPSFRRWFDVEPTWTYQSSFSFPVPAVDVNEGEKNYTVTAELPGLEEKDIEVTVTDHLLTIKDEKSKDHHVSERAYGSFQRSFTMPEGVDATKIAAVLTKGVLTVTLPKTAEAQKPAKKIEVKKAA